MIIKVKYDKSTKQITVENDIVANNKITANEYVGPIDGGIF